MTWGNLPFLDRLRKVKEAGFTHYEFWPWRNKDIDGDRRFESRAGPHSRPVLGVAGQGIRPRDHQSRPGATGGVRRGDPVGGARGQEARASRRFAWWPAKRPGLFARGADPGRHRRSQGGCQDRRARGNHDHPRAAQHPGRSSSPAHRPFRARRTGSEDGRLAQRQDALRHLPPADQRGQPDRQHSSNITT